MHAVTLTWLSAVEGAVDDEDEEPTGGPGSEGQLSLPAVVTLMDSRLHFWAWRRWAIRSPK